MVKQEHRITGISRLNAQIGHFSLNKLGRSQASTSSLRDLKSSNPRLKVETIAVTNSNNPNRSNTSRPSRRRTLASRVKNSTVIHERSEDMNTRSYYSPPRTVLLVQTWDGRDVLRLST